MRPFLTLALLAVAFAACDTIEDDDEVRVVDFTIDRDDYTVSDDRYILSYEGDDISSGTARAALRDALREAGDGALVIAYIESGILIGSASTGQTYTPMPATRAFRGEIAYDVDNDGVADQFVPVETVLTLEYSFDNQDFYFDVVSSDPVDDFGGVEAFLDDVLPRDPEIRVVTIPATLQTRASARRVDYRSYESVKAAYGLPE